MIKPSCKQHKWEFQDVPAMLAVLDEQLICRHASLGWRNHLGLPKNDGAELLLEDLLLLDDEVELTNLLTDIFTHKNSVHDISVSLLGKLGVAQGLLAACLIQQSNEPPHLLLNATCGEQLDKTLAELRRIQSEHGSILSAVGEGIYGLDKNGMTIFANAASTEIVGWKIEDILGKPAHDVHHHTHADGTPYPRDDCPVYAALKDGKIHHVDDEVFWHSNGSAVPVEYTSTPILQDGELNGAVVVFHDISERKEIERQREAAYQEINALKEKLELERDYLRDEINVTSDFGEIIGDSSALQHTMAQIEAVASTQANVLILGESGVGKEMIARAIHAKSERSEKPLVKVNCASIPKELFESEFFGHIKGAFTGAHRDRTGRLQLAAGGTIFLDEIGEIPLSLQSKLLRALQEHEFERVGDDKTIKVDVRIVAATNTDLEAEVKAGRFREDLFYRLSVFPIKVPPLRERIKDIAPLAQHFLNRSCAELGRDQIKLSKQQVTRLQQHKWPGNIRELKNIIERAVILSKGNRARLDLVLPDQSQGEEPEDNNQIPDSTFVTDAEFRQLEKTNIIAALKYANWQVWGENGAAELLGIKPSTLTYRMKNFGINKTKTPYE